MDVFAARPTAWNPRLLMFSGEPLVPTDLDRLRGGLGWTARVLHVLASTDAAGYIATLDVEANRYGDAAVIPAGRAAEARRLLILDDTGEEMPAGEVGEIVVAADDLPVGYWRQPELTAATYRQDPADPLCRWFFTGDLGRLRSDGLLEVIGRKDDIVKIRGYRVQTSRVEAALRDLADVAEAVVVSRDDLGPTPRLVGYVRLASGALVTPLDLRNALLSQLPEFMVPWRIVILAALPLTAGGKVARRSLPPPSRDRPLGMPDWSAPNTKAEVTLAALWSDLLGIDLIGRDDDFFELGGDSLDLVAIATRFAEQGGAELGEVDLFGAPNLAAMAARLQAALSLSP
jgi:acyl-coenzyme A synthetase/AMP-(fatty) acid ligase